MKPRPGERCAIVLGLDVSGYGITRSLGREGVPVVGLWRRANESGRFSRYCLPLKVEPDEDAAWVAMLDELLERYQDPVLYPSNDRYADLLARQQERLRDRARFHWVTPDAIDVVLDKTRIAEVARGLDLPVPRTHRPAAADLAAEAAAFVYPCIVKPITTFRAGLPRDQKTITCRSAEELLALYRDAPELRATTLWQELIEGDDDSIYQGTVLATTPGAVTAIASVRKIRQFVPGFGIMCFGRTEWEPAVVEQTTRLVRALGWTGMASVEFKRRATDGRLYFIEMNPRLPWYNVLFADAGVNLPYYAWRDLRGRPVPAARQREGIGWISLASDLASFWQRRAAGGLTAGAWLGSLTGVRSFSWYENADPVPALAAAVRLSGMGWRYLTRGLPGVGR